ncbi:MAG: hypothetical protein JW715_12825 [Sedimentisphaerales bacterium]|nr:hypothetical protein [Sedimentisphaerales bacterium]
MQIQEQKRYRLFLIVLVYIVVASIGIRVGVFQYISRERGFFNSFILALFLTQICILDGRIMGKPLSIFSYWLVFILFGIAVPVCIVRAHGLRGVGIVIAHFLGFILVYVISFLITSLLVYGSSFLFEDL